MYNTNQFPDHSYDDIRKAAIDILARRWKSDVPSGFKIPSDYDYFKEAVGNLLNTKEARYGILRPEYETMSGADCNTFLEVFWELFREGIITLGLFDAKGNRDFPFFRIATHGLKIIENKDMYFFHDAKSYESLIRNTIPDIDEVTLLYLREAVHTFYSGCYLASSVMLGVASEQTLLLLFEKFDQKMQAPDKKIKGRNIYDKFTSFKNKLNQEMGNNSIIVPFDIKESIDDNLEGIMNVIRRLRNDAGHPTGKTINKEQCFAYLTLFIMYCKTAYRLIDCLS
jgi:hypothetical protein